MQNGFDAQVLAWLAFAIVGFVLFTRSRGTAAHGCPKHLYGSHRADRCDGGYGTTIESSGSTLHRLGRLAIGLFRLAFGAAALGIVGGILWYWFMYLPQSFPG